MNRYKRPKFDLEEMAELEHDEERNRLLFDWWCDEGEPLRCPDPRPSDRLLYIRSLRGEPKLIRSRAPIQNDPAPPVTVPVPQGFCDVYLLSKPEHVHLALTDSEQFSVLPYAALGGASFLLGLDPGAGYGDVDWHAQQRALVREALDYPPAGLRDLAKIAVDQAALTSLARPAFDMASFAGQAALRYTGQLFGYGFQDHGLLEEVSTATYRALQYLAIGKHFVTEPLTLPTAQQALGRLVTRTSQLMEDYTRLARSPRRYGFPPAREWPDGVQPWSQLGLDELGEPLLKRLPKISGAHGDADLLSGRDRATVAATLLAGTLGNIQSAVCLLVQSLIHGPIDEWLAAKDMSDDALEADLNRRLAKLPPVPVLPRRTIVEVTLGATHIPPGTDCLLLLEGQPGCPHAHTAEACPRIWGDVSGSPEAIHGCLGQRLSMPLIAAMVRHTLSLPGLKLALDPLTGEALAVERLWGFACTRYPLSFEREQYRVQQNLIVSMRIKAPINENAARLRLLIAAGVPRIEHVLKGFGGVHFAWFEFTDDDAQLVLRTIYDGEFESYVQYFALQAGDLFDGLFEYLEGAPRRPVAEHPHDFVETLRRFNRAPVGGYLFSIHPRVEATHGLEREGTRP